MVQGADAERADGRGSGGRRSVLGRAGRALFGPAPIDRLGHTTALSSGADAFVAVSLAGSLFFNVSIDAARPRMVTYLLVTMAPFAIVAPLIGPFVDRVRGGHRVVIAAACLGRFVLCLLLARDLRSLLLYPEVFGILVLNKTHAVAKSALVPRLVDDPERLVRTNSRLSRVSTAAGAVGGAVAAGVLSLGDGALVLRVGALAYLGALLTTLRIPRSPAVRSTVVSRLAGEQELRAPTLRLALSSMGLVRAAVGFFAFFAAFSLKAAGAPTWAFGVVIAAGGVGGFLATFTAPFLRRLLIEERLLEISLAVPAVLALVTPKEPAELGLVVVAFGLGMAANVGRQAFDSIVQRDAPDAERGRAFAGLEARLQLAWVVGALLPVLGRPGVTAGLLLMALALLAGAVAYGTTARTAARRGWGAWAGASVPLDLGDEAEAGPLPRQLMRTARWLQARGAGRQAVVVAAAAEEAVRPEGGPASVAGEARRRAMAGEALPEGEVARVLDAVEALVEEAVTSGAVAEDSGVAGPAGERPLSRRPAAESPAPPSEAT